MNRRLIKVVSLILVIILLTVALLAGCGKEEEETETTTVKLALLVPLSGPASIGYLPAVAQYKAYVKYLNAENPVPGVEFEVITYDTKGGSAEASSAYQWAKSEGAKFIAYADSTTTEQLADSADADKFPIIDVVGTAIASEVNYVFNNQMEFNQQTEGFARWLESAWDYDGMGRSPRVGVFGWNDSFGIDHAKGVREYCEAHPASFDWVSQELAPYGTTTWAAEVDDLSTCDYVVVGTYAGGVSSFINEYRDAGYEGIFAFTDAAVSFINMVYIPAVGKAALEDSVWVSFNHYLTIDPSELGDTIKDTVIPDYANEEEAGYFASNPWAAEAYIVGCIIATEAWRDAIEQLDEDQDISDIDGEMLYDALTSLEINIDGYPTIGYTATSRIPFGSVRVYEYNQMLNNFQKLSDWIVVVE